METNFPNDDELSNQNLSVVGGAPGNGDADDNLEDDDADELEDDDQEVSLDDGVEDNAIDSGDDGEGAGNGGGRMQNDQGARENLSDPEGSGQDTGESVTGSLTADGGGTGRSGI